MITHALDQGRHCNKLFQIAAVIGTAIKHGFTWGVPSFEWAQYFKNPFPEIQPTENYYQENGFHYNEINVQDATRLSGYWQSEKYFKHCEAYVREQFEFTDEIILKMKTKYGFLLESNLCAVHVRRTDYVSNPNHLALPFEYYRRAMIGMPGKTFLVFSDDINYCKQNFPGNMFFVTGNSDIEDFVLMTLCKDHIIANSTFSWWAAWLCKHENKRIIAPKVWFGKGLKYTHDTKDLIPEGWIKQ